ncbi:MAG TPA: hypothetical protein VKA60_06510 [Blastocatellia bacterium]|nr:hypothetical protein [Blastocatellia bacterium]
MRNASAVKPVPGLFFAHFSGLFEAQGSRPVFSNPLTAYDTVEASATVNQVALKVKRYVNQLT